MQFPFGLGTALITPFKNDFSVDYEALARLVDLQIASAVDYLVVLGTTGEPATMTMDEKQQLLDFVVKRVANKKPIVLGLGGNNTAELVRQLDENIWKLQERNIAAILSVCPYYNKPSQEGLFLHFNTIAKHSPVPVILYNVPGRTGVNLQPETVMRIWEANSNKILAIKEASGNVEQIMHLIALAKNKLHVISGDDGLAYQLMNMGAVGLISVASNAFPDAMGHIVHDRKAYIQAEYDDIIRLLFAEGSPAGIKTVLELQGMIQNVVRLPLAPNSPAIKMEIQQAIQSLN